MELQQVHGLFLAPALALVWSVAADCGDTAARAADPTLLILALEIFSVGENPIFAMWQHREEVAEPEGQAGPGGTSPFPGTHSCSHRWHSSFQPSLLAGQQGVLVSPRAGTQTFTP